MAKLKNYNKKDKVCKVCLHENLIEIETAFIVDGMSSREVEKLIEDNGWEKVSYVTLCAHMKDHVDEKRELVIKYLAEKRNIMNGEIPDEIDEQGIRLKELKHLDRSILEANILVVQASKAIQEQLAIRVVDVPGKDGKAVKNGKKIVGKDGKPTEKQKSYIPLQPVLVNLYKTASEELRQSIKVKLEVLGVDSNSKTADNMGTLVDMIMQTEE